MTMVRYHLLDHELCHSTSKPIGNEKNTIKSFIVFDITSYGYIFRVVVGSQTVVFLTTHIDLKMIRDYLQYNIYTSVTRNVLRN